MAPRAFLTILVLVLAGAAAPAAGQSCRGCHTDRSLLESIAEDPESAERLHVDGDDFDSSIHGVFGAACTTCHAGIDGYPHPPEPPPPGCGNCHGTAGQEWARSIHGRPHPVAGTPPATCWDCHGSHDIRLPSDPQSSVYRLSRYETCATCHGDPAIMGRFGREAVDEVTSYVNSVHGQALLEKGLSVAPTCTDCHGSVETGIHGIDAVSDPASMVHRENVVETCGSCHLGIQNEYGRGIHGGAFRAGIPDAPTCTSCHREHGVLPVTSPASSVYPTHIAQTCTACHDREEFNDRYGIPTGRGKTFLGSYHGVALVNEELTVANCESCHGAHGILPSSHPDSRVHRNNLVETCGSCHPGIGPRVAEGKIHVTSVREDIGLVAYGLQWFYYLVIAGTILYAVAVIALDQYRHRVVDPRRGGGHG